jgi:hypothetical protein
MREKIFEGWVDIKKITLALVIGVAVICLGALLINGMHLESTNGNPRVQELLRSAP